LKINENGQKKAGNQKLLPYKMIPKNAIWNHNFLLKGHRVGYKIHIMKKVVTLLNDDGF
jgi:hypothetical protein